MSHFTVLVVGDNWEKQLAPYNKGLEVEPYVDQPAKEVKREYRKIMKKAKTSDEDYMQEYKHRPDMPIEKWAEDWYGQSLDAEGNLLTTYNPDSKWDWYLMGGRWTGFFLLKDGAGGEIGVPGAMTKACLDVKRADQARKGDIDWEGMVKESLEEYERKWKEALACEDSAEKYFRYDVKEAETREDYIRRQAFPSTFAVVKDGKWYEKGKMGWWAIVTDEKDPSDWEDEFRALIADLPDDTLLTLVDCHI